MRRPPLELLSTSCDLGLAALLIFAAPALTGCAGDPGVTTDSDGGVESTGTTTVGDEPFCLEPSSPGDEPPVSGEPSCVTTPGDHAAARCAGGDCPITADVVWRCDREFTQLGLRVATGDASAYLLASSDERALLLSVEGSQAEIDRTLPFESLRQTALIDRGVDGELHVAADTTRVDADHDGGMFVLRGQPGAWSVLAVDDAEDSPWVYRIFGLESSSDAIHAWYDVGLEWPLEMAYTYVNSQSASANAYPIARDSWTRWTLDHAGSSVALSFAARDDGWQLTGRIHDTMASQYIDRLLGAPVVACAPLAYRPIPPTRPNPPAAAVPSYAAVIQHPDALRIAWPREGAEHDPDDEFVVPDTPLAAFACPRDDAGRGLAVDGFAAAQTSDGRLWLAWVDAACEPELDAVLHLASFDFAARALSQRLELAIPEIAPIGRALDPNNARMLDLRAWGSRLAIGLRLRDEQGPAAARLIQIDTSTL